MIVVVNLGVISKAFESVTTHSISKMVFLLLLMPILF